MVGFHIVTPDGAERTVNACYLGPGPVLGPAGRGRGGGGHFFGVVLSGYPTASSPRSPPHLHRHPPPRRHGRRRRSIQLLAEEPLGFDPVSFYTPVSTPFIYEGRIESTTPAERHHRPRHLGLVPLVVTHLQTVGSVAWNSSYAARGGEARGPRTRGRTSTRRTRSRAGGRDSYWGGGRETTGGCWGSSGKRYDPTGLLTYWKCVGFEDDDDVGS
ncbi:hypothetical protein F4775DRAFT_536071 [Biscogniauxia sp. FL1348]|nr:hypothetical protein F4775DRAFT_536071 [Biscogniauxia sp. FL1348]